MSYDEERTPVQYEVRRIHDGVMEMIDKNNRSGVVVWDGLGIGGHVESVVCADRAASGQIGEAALGTLYPDDLQFLGYFQVTDSIRFDQCVPMERHLGGKSFGGFILYWEFVPQPPMPSHHLISDSEWLIFNPLQGGCNSAPSELVLSSPIEHLNKATYNISTKCRPLAAFPLKNSAYLQSAIPTFIALLA